MKKILINGLHKLSGCINIKGAKNSVVALIPAAILAQGEVNITNVPKLSDTENLRKIIELLGGKISFGDSTLIINVNNIKNETISEELSHKLRASYYFMGALLAKFHHVEMYFPGGCKIGARPIDFHIEAFEKMGATVTRDEHDKYVIDAPNLHGATIDLKFPSVGATVNVMLAASLANGITTINNAAKEPEIENIQEFINAMGGKIKGAGTSTIIIEGVSSLHGAKIEVIPDRIAAGTYIMIGAVIGDNFEVKNINPSHLSALFEKLDEMGVNYELTDDSVKLSACKHLLPTNLKTLAYPGFPTDLGQPMAVLLALADGECDFIETIYETRTGHFPELNKMGANITYEGKSAKIIGPAKLVGCDVNASDLRAGAALIIAGLVASGTTKISNIEHILRGYENIVGNLEKVGADIRIIEE